MGLVKMSSEEIKDTMLRRAAYKKNLESRTKASKKSHQEKPSDALYRGMYAAEKKHRSMFAGSVALGDTVRHRKRITIKTR